MDESEAVVAEWLRSEGHEFRHLGRDDPPDFVVDGDIAVEVTTISPPTERRMFQFFSDKLFKALGAAENGCAYPVFVEYEDEKMFDGTDEDKKKRELKRLITQELEAHYRNPNSGTWRHGRRVIPLCHGITLEIGPWPSEHPADYKYTVRGLGASKGEIVIPTLVENIQAAIEKKSAKPRIRERAEEYREWWLVVTSFYWPGQDGWKTVSDALVLKEPWKHLFAVNAPGRSRASQQLL